MSNSGADRQTNLSSQPWLLKALILGVILVGLAVTIATLTGATASNEAEAKLTHVVKRGNLSVTVIEQGGLESSENTEVKCNVRGDNTVTWVIENGTQVEPGDVLVELDTLAIESTINERSKYAHSSQAAVEQSTAQLARSKLAVSEYEDGRFVSQLMTLEKNLAVSESDLLIAKNVLDHSKKMSERGFVHDLEIERKAVRVRQAELEVEANKTAIEVLQKYTKAMQLKTLEGNLNVAMATHEANVERAIMDAKRRDLAVEELEHCVIKAEKSGLVIFPSAAAWKSTPDVAEGATVHKNQVLLLMPNLNKMQVKVGIHESLIDRIKPGLKALISLPDEQIEGEVLSVASVARPAGWWTGNVVKYDTIISLPEGQLGLKPGMSAEVEVIIAALENVVKIPVTAVLQTNTETLCWIKQANGSTKRRVIEIGDSDDVYIAVTEGLDDGEEVVLNPVAYIKEAQVEAMKAIDESELEAEAPEDTPTAEKKSKAQTKPSHP